LAVPTLLNAFTAGGSLAPRCVVQKGSWPHWGFLRSNKLAASTLSLGFLLKDLHGVLVAQRYNWVLIFCVF